MTTAFPVLPAVVCMYVCACVIDEVCIRICVFICVLVCLGVCMFPLRYLRVVEEGSLT